MSSFFNLTTPKQERFNRFFLAGLTGRKKMPRDVYKNPQSGQPLLAKISSGCHTPPLEVKFCNLVKPYYYPNSPTIPRYSITCVVDPIEHAAFMNGIQTIEKNENVDTIIKNEVEKGDGGSFTTGKLLVKFQTKDHIPVYRGDPRSDDKPELIELEDELAKGEKIIVVYDILRYTKKNTMNVEHGLSFKPSAIYYLPQEVASGEN